MTEMINDILKRVKEEEEKGWLDKPAWVAYIYLKTKEEERKVGLYLHLSVEEEYTDPETGITQYQTFDSSDRVDFYFKDYGLPDIEVEK